LQRAPGLAAVPQPRALPRVAQGIIDAAPRKTLLATLVQAEITAAASGDIESATISHDAAGKVLALLPEHDSRITAARGKIRGYASNPPETALRAWLAGVARRLAMNVNRSAHVRRRNIEVSPEVDCVDGRSPPDAIIDARGLLEKLARQTNPRGLQTLLLLAEGLTVAEIAREVGISAPTVIKEIRLARRRLAFARDRAPWQKPKQPPPQSPRSRKRQR
jgi:DNA-directed RNA polymerase specialized sigma24 family protein